MKFRTSDYQLLVKRKGQTFSKEIPQFTYDKKNNILVDALPKDIHAFVQSSADCALSALLDKFGLLPTVALIEQQVQNRTYTDSSDIAEYSYKDDLIEDARVLDMVEQIREEYNMPIDYTPEQVFDDIKKRKLSIDEHIINLKNKLQGGVVNAQKTIEPSQVRENVSPNGSQSPQA